MAATRFHYLRQKLPFIAVTLLSSLVIMRRRAIARCINTCSGTTKRWSNLTGSDEWFPLRLTYETSKNLNRRNADGDDHIGASRS